MFFDSLSLLFGRLSLYPYLSVFLNDLMIRLKMKTRTTAPMIAGTIAKFATCGPQFPNINVPSHAPTNPAIIFPITPPGIFLPAIRPAIQPIIPPTIYDQIKLIQNTPLSLNLLFHCFYSPSKLKHVSTIEFSLLIL
jgi:hypothetical protein